MNLFNKITFEKEKDIWELNLEKPIYCQKDPELCSQYPCPSCSAVIAAITKASGKKIQIKKAIYNGKKTTFHLKIGEK